MREYNIAGKQPISHNPETTSLSIYNHNLIPISLVFSTTTTTPTLMLNILNQNMQETLHQSSNTTPSPFPHNFPPSLSRPKHLHFSSPPLSKHILINQSPTPPLKSSTHPSSETLQEKLLYLDSLGIDSFHCLSSHPPIIQTPLSQIKAVIAFLSSINLTIHTIRRAVAMCPDILTSSLSNTLIPAVTFLLRDAHVDRTNLCHVIHRRPRLLVCSVDKVLRPTLSFLEEDVGVEDVSKWASLLSGSVDAKFVPRVQYFVGLGFEERESLEMFRRFPALFCYSIEGNLEPKVEFLVGEMGRELRDLLEFPQYFSFSLENRIKARHRMCVENGVCLPLDSMLKSNDRVFRERLEVCCSSSTPVRTSPFWCIASKISRRSGSSKTTSTIDIDVT